MTSAYGVVVNGKIVLDTPPEWPDGTQVRVEQLVGLPDPDRPSTPEEIARDLALMDQSRGPAMTPGEEAEWHKARAEQKAWELARWEEHSRKLEELFK